MKIVLPDLYSVVESNALGTIMVYECPAREVTLQEVQRSNRERLFKVLESGEEVLFRLGLRHSTAPKVAHTVDILTNDYAKKVDEFDSSELQWARHPKMSSTVGKDVAGQAEATWGSVDLRARKERSLRSPQIGAVHKILGHWALSNSIATIVMPTGTGKTETMLATMLAAKCSRLLVTAPTSALRDQIYFKFLKLGILKQFNLCPRETSYPVVGRLEHFPKSEEQLEAFIEKCNVIVTTMKIAGEMETGYQRKVAELCRYLFVDEAHHVAAKTWASLIEAFSGNFVLQFTATPYREDGKVIPGETVFNYSLSDAIKAGYFTKIDFKPVIEYDPQSYDVAIAKAAVEVLRRDRKSHNHLMMARVSSTTRANVVLNIYKTIAPDLNPVEIHTGIKSVRERERIKRQILNHEAKIVVCVDMLGEGFDLPELKIAAFHDVRKGLVTTLQLAGRFTRNRKDLGEATFIANLGNIEVAEQLQDLYAQDADWNKLLGIASEEKMGSVQDLYEYISCFRSPDNIPLQNIRAAASAIVYQGQPGQSWNPRAAIAELKAGFETFVWEQNDKDNILVAIGGQRGVPKWLKMDSLEMVSWELFVLYWNQKDGLLFINHSDNRAPKSYQLLAQTLVPAARLISGATTFRCFGNISQLKLQNVGLREELDRLVRYIKRSGSDVDSALSRSQRSGVSKSDIAGTGYEGGRRTSIGCSAKGRIWSKLTVDLSTLRLWCDGIGTKLLDSSIDPDKVLEGALVPRIVEEVPSETPIWIDWPDLFVRRWSHDYRFSVGDEYVSYQDLDIKLVQGAHSKKGIFKFKVGTPRNWVTYSLTLRPVAGQKYMTYSVENLSNTPQKVANKTTETSAAAFFEKHPPVIFFEKNSTLSGNLFVSRAEAPSPFNKEDLLEWDWDGVDITVESQGLERLSDSIQYKVFRQIEDEFDILVDDDGAGEFADIVALRTKNESMEIALYHLKYSSEPKPGARVDDFYEVCGQAQRCIRCAESPDAFFKELLRRNALREKNQGVGRIEKGSIERLEEYRRMAKAMRLKFSVSIVQPGLSKSKVSENVLRLLGTSESYLMETFHLPLSVICSP